MYSCISMLYIVQNTKYKVQSTYKYIVLCVWLVWLIAIIVIIISINVG